MFLLISIILERTMFKTFQIRKTTNKIHINNKTVIFSKINHYSKLLIKKSQNNSRKVMKFILNM